LTLIPWVIFDPCDGLTWTDNRSWLLLDIPDYPPPTFQEAISSLALQIPVTATEGGDVDAHEDVNRRGNEQAVQQRTSATFDSDSSSSDSSHDFCDVRNDETAPATPPKKARNLHGLAFPSTPLRGRNKSRAMHDDAEGGHVTTQPAAAATRRHNSLSPLRIFPSLHLTINDRAASAHPTTEHASSSPYQHSGGMSSFFRSTTSLALFQGNGNTTPITLKSKSSMTNLSSNTISPKRKLFSPSKGKERAERSERLDKAEIDPETDQLDSWEVIDSTEAAEADTLFEPKKSKDKEGRRRSPDRMVEMPPVEASRSHAEATPTAPVSTLETPVPQPHPLVQSQPPTSIHPLSVRDRKTPIPPVERPQRPSPQPVPPRPNSPPALAPAASRVVQSHDSPSKPGSGPLITTVRVARRQTTGAMPTLSTKRSQVFNSSPLGIQTWKPGEESPTKVVGDTAVGSEVDPSLQTALETPLPPSPIGSVGSRLHLSASTMTSTGFSSDFQSFMAEIAGLQFTPSTDSFSMAADTLGFASGTETPTRKHYHGRPLPPAPGPTGPGVRHPIDSVYLTPSSPPAGEVGREEKDKGKNSNCPEGLLIDLDDNTFVNAVNTPEAARSQTDLRLTPSSAFPVVGYGHPHRGHAASASASAHNLASQPKYLSPLQVVNMTHNQGQVNSVPHVWAPCGYDSETDDELPEYEVSPFGWA
jgi:hypothetical protein